MLAHSRRVDYEDNRKMPKEGDHVERCGFQFDLFLRNAHLVEKLGYQPPKVIKTGTTIAGMIFEGGVVLGADTRATEGPVVADKNCAKIHYLFDNIYCCGAGTAADTEQTTNIISSRLRLHRLSTDREPRVQTACRMLKQMLFRYGGYIGAYLVLGGVDLTGPHLFTIHAHGSTDKLPYVSMGSGSLAAMANFEARFKPGMTMEEAKSLVSEAIQGGIYNDLGSGSNVDICVITSKGVEYIRPYLEASKKGERQGDYTYSAGTTQILGKIITPVKIDIVSSKTQKMDTD